MFFTNISNEERLPKLSTETKIEVSGIVGGKALDPKSGEILTETRVREYFADTPVLARIAYCESKFTHFNENGSILRGEVTPKDLGVMQINEYYHSKTADALDINLYTLEGNMEYAKWLYEREGTVPWAPSQKCWDTYNELARI